MNFRDTWAERVVVRLEQLARDDPGRGAGLRYSVETLHIELTDRADTWGESRAGPYRLGYAGILSALVRVDAENGVVRIVDVKLEGRRPTG